MNQINFKVNSLFYRLVRLGRFLLDSPHNDYHHGDVVRSVLGNGSVGQHLGNLGSVVAGANSAVHQVRHLRVAAHVKEAVARNDERAVLRAQRSRRARRHAGHILFGTVVSQRARHAQNARNAAVHHNSAAALD